jgi:metallo-beta-lactamase family protein
MQLTFWGAARQVTGSMFLLELNDGYKILIDCGLDLQRKFDGEEQHSLFPFEASEIHLMVLTHAHIDHSGFIPNLIREGFEGKVLCTSPTYDLTRLLLEDSAALNQRRIKKYHDTRKQSYDKIQEISIEAQGWFLPNQVTAAIQQFYNIPFKQRVKVKDGLYLTLIPTGHLLGAANVLFEVEEDGKTKKICFSGDLGRKNYPLLKDPEPVPEVDYLVCESTYGNRRHLHKKTAEEMLLKIIKDTCVDKSGRLLIPAFSVGRTQSLLYVLNKLCAANALPPIKIFADSPLALQSTKVYEKYKSWLSEEAQDFAKENDQLFDFDNLVYLENIKQSKALANYNQPCIIISSSGMIQGGRIEFHVKKNIQNPFATILMIGYAAEGTLGHQLINGLKAISTPNGSIPVLAKVESIDVFSGHGDLDDLMEFIGYQSTERLKTVFLTHGEYSSMQDFKNTILEAGYKNVEIPERGQTFTL